MRVLPLLLCVLLGACARRVRPAAAVPGAQPAVGAPSWTSPLDRDHALVGRIWDVAGNRFVDERMLTEQVTLAELSVLGEQHDSADAHALQARLLAAVVASGRTPALVAEMLDETEQPAIDASRQAQPNDVDAFARALDWEHSGWPSWSLYRPVFATAFAARLSIVAAGVERKRTMTIAHEGTSALEPALVQRFGLDQPLPAPIEGELRDEMRDTHCGMLPDSMLGAMVLVQRVRDAVLAEHLTAPHPGGALLIAGNGHARSDRGVPALIRDHLGKRVLSVALLEVQHDWKTPTQYAGAFAAKALPFDYAWFMPRANDTDHCAELRSSGAQPAHAPPLK